MRLNIFLKPSIPDKIPPAMQDAVEKLRSSKNKEDCLKRAYGILTKKYRGYRLMTYIRFFEIFEDDMEKIWAKDGFLHCTNMNYLMRILLVKSGFFQDSDIDLRWTVYWGSPHQYMSIDIGDKKVDVDIWGHVNGVKFGEHAGL